MNALARVAVTQGGIEGFHHQGAVSESPFGSGYRGDTRENFSEIAGSASGLLTDRECTVLQLLGHGLSNKEAARNLGISPETVKSHVKNIFQKLCVYRRAQAVSLALGLGFINPG